MSFSEIGTHVEQQRESKEHRLQHVIATRHALGLPRLKPNGGWSTGREASQNAAWATVPTVPDAGFSTSINLRSAKPPQGSCSQFAPTSFRPGNNSPSLYGLVDEEIDLGLDGICVSSIASSDPNMGQPTRTRIRTRETRGWDASKDAFNFRIIEDDQE